MRLLVLTLILPFLIEPISGIKSRIIGGSNAKAAEFPFAAAVYTRTETGTYFCGGALLDDQWVLTAAQCAYGAIQFTIYLGSNSISGPDSNRKTISATEYYYPSNFNPMTLEHDVALIKLHIPIEFTAYIKPVDQFPGYEIPVGQECIAIGWGQTSDSDTSLSPILQRVTLTTLSNPECAVIYGEQLTYDMACMGGNFNEGACLGDTGSPLLEIKSDGQYEHVGIASFLSSNGCESTDPSGYTRTLHYLHWIKEVMNNYTSTIEK